MNPLARFLRLFRRKALEAEMAEEMRLHLELQTERNIAAGMDPDEARYAARRMFGGVEQIKEVAREQRGWVWVEQTGRDFRFAGRALAKSPGFASAVVATLAVGIGATTAIVSFAWPLVFPSVAFPAPERMVVLVDSQSSGAPDPAPYPFFSYGYRMTGLRDAATSFAQIGGIRPEQANLVVQGEPAAVNVGWATADYFPLLGAATARGRLFLPEDYRRRDGETAVLSWALWEQRFGADPSIVGREILLGGRNRRVVGVLAKQFVPPPQFTVADVYLPEAPATIPTVFQFSWLHVVGRLKPGITLAQAQQELSALQLPASPAFAAMEKLRVRAAPLTDYYGRNTTIYWVFFGAVAFLHAIACSNAASLMLARTLTRRREFGVRLALGGSGWRIVRLLLAESLILAAAAGAGGVLIAHWGRWALALVQGGSVATADQRLTNLLLVVTPVTISLLTSLLVILVPAWRIRRAGIGEVLKEGAGALGDSRGSQRLRGGLVVLQAALTVALLAGAGLTLRSFQRLERVGFGFDPGGKLAVMALLPASLSPEAFVDLASRFRDRLAHLPGVKDATQSTVLPLANFFSFFPLKVDGHPELGDIPFSANRISPEYFATLGLPIRQGRGFENIHPGDPPVVIVNETGARRCFGSDNPIGRFLDAGLLGKWQVVGVVGDVRESGRRGEIRPQVYFPFQQPPVATGSLVELVRLEPAPPAGLGDLIRRTAYEIDPQLVVTVALLSDSARQDVAKERGAMAIFEVLSTLAVVLATTGLFAMVACTVAQRQREFGVRLALGATPGDVLRLVLGRGLALAVAGVTLGLGVAWASTRFLSSVLFDISPHDPVTYGAVTAGLLAVSVIACWLPARCAAKVDPMVALRCE